MKNTIRKVLLIMLVIITVFIYGCSCKDDPTPTPPFPIDKDDVVYMTVKQGDLSYDIYKSDMYINMKNKYGTGVIVDWADELILKSVGKRELYNSLFGKSDKFDEYDNTPYWDKVNDDAARNLMELEKFPNGRSGLTTEEIKARETEFSDNFAVYGYFTEEDIIYYYHKKLAMNLIAKDYQELYRSNIDFEPSQYQNSYLGNYYNEFYMILIPFTSSTSYTETLKNMGISVQAGTTEKAKWVWDDTKVALTVNEVVEAYLEIYEKSFLFKKSVSEADKLVNGVDYTVEDGKYVFNTTDEGKLYYSKDMVKYLDSDLYKLLSNEFSAYSKDSTNENNTWYWAQGYEFDGKCYTALLLKKIDKMPYEEAKPLIREKLLASEIDDEFAGNAMLTLRQVFGLMIYDVFLQTGYANTYGSGSIPELEVDNGDVVVTFKDTLLKKDDLFNLLDKRFGADTAIELVNYYNALYDKEINNVYDLTKENASDRILNKERWEYAWETAEMEKKDFESGTYLKYGYAPSYGWENFLEAIYNVRSTQELAYHYLRENCLYDYLVKKYNINNYGEESLLWSKTVAKMNERLETEHYANGMVVELYILDENGNRGKVSDYSDAQKALIKELYEKIVDLLNRNPENYLDDANDLVEYYNLSGYKVRTDYSTQFLGIDFSKYKSAGIQIGIDNLGTFSYDDMTEEIGAVAKKIWEENVPSEEVIIYGKDGDKYNYIEAERAYFVYININNIEPTNVEGRYLPTFEECAKYLEGYYARLDKKDYEISEEVYNLVGVYYFPIYTEQIGIYATALMFYNAQANYEINLKLASYSMDTYRRVLNINIKDCDSKLQYHLTY